MPRPIPRTQFFVADDATLFARLAGWRRRPPLLPAPIAQRFLNPFTNAHVERPSRFSPERPEPNPLAARDAQFRDLPHVDAPALSSVDVESLAELLLGGDHDDDRVDFELVQNGRLVGPPTDADADADEFPLEVLEVPAALVAKLASMSHDDCRLAVVDWATELDQGLAFATLVAVATLARLAVEGGAGLFMVDGVSPRA